MKLTIKGRVLQDIEIAGSYPDHYIRAGSYEDHNTEVPDEDLDQVDGCDLDMWISESR